MKRVILIPPNGGWGWLVVFGSATVCMTSIPYLQIFGLLYDTHLQNLNATSSDASLVYSIMLLILNAGGPFAGSLIKMTSPRVACATGCTLVSSGVILSGFSRSIFQMVLSYGLFVGLGIGLIQTAAFVSVNSYFSTKRGRAVGVSVAGIAVGQLFMPQVTSYLQGAYGFTGACMLLGAMSLHGLVGCALLQPVDRHMKEVRINEEDVPSGEESRVMKNSDLHRKKEEDLSGNELHRRDVCESLQTSVEDDDVEDTTALIEHHKSSKRSMLRRIADYFGLQLLANFKLVSTIVAVAFGFASLQNFALHYPFFLKYSVGLKTEEAATCMSAIAGADLIGRLTLPSLADKYKVSAKTSIVITSVWFIIARQYLAVQTTFTSLVIASMLCGLGISMFIVSQFIAISDSVKDPGQIPNAIGLSLLMNGVCAMPLTMFLGWIRDYTDSYFVTMTTQNVLLVLVVITLSPEVLWNKYKSLKDLERS